MQHKVWFVEIVSPHKEAAACLPNSSAPAPQTAIVQEKNEEGKVELKVDVWFGKRATLASIRTLCSHVQNMISAPPTPFLSEQPRCRLRITPRVASLATLAPDGGPSTVR